MLFIQKQTLIGTLEKRYFEICVQSSYQMIVGGFAFSGASGYWLAPSLETDFFMDIPQLF